MNYLEHETATLDLLKNKFETDGYKVTIEPRNLDIMQVLNGYIPDMLAEREHEKILIEIKRSRNPSVEKALKLLAEKIEAIEGWKFKFFFEDEQIVNRGPHREEIERILTSIDAANKLVGSEQEIQAAFLLGWAALEAAARHLYLDKFERAQSPGRIITTLAESGDLDQNEAKTLLGFSRIRNLLIHGQISRTVSADELKALLGIIQKLLTPSA